MATDLQDLLDLLDSTENDTAQFLHELEEVGYREVDLKWEDTDRELFHLVVIRESQKWDRRMLRGMALQTLRPLVGKVPGAETMLEAAEDDLVCFQQGARGDAWRDKHCTAVVALREHGGRQYGWKLRVDGTWFIIAATSARKKDEGEDLSNPFTRDLIDHIRTEPTDKVWAGPFTRLVRRASFGGQLREAFESANHGRGLTVHIKEYPSGIVFRPTAGGMATMMWDLLGTIAEQEVRMSTLRMILGRIVAADDDIWDRSPHLLPPYVCLSEDGRKHLLPSDNPRGWAEARAWVHLAAEAHDADLTVAELIKRLSDDPNVNAAILTGENAGRSLKEHTNHHQAILSRFKWIPAMRRGRYVAMQGLPMDGCTPDDVLGKQVFARTTKVNGTERSMQYVLLDWRIPVLDAIDDETWDKAEKFVKRLKSEQEYTPRETPRDVLPFGSIFVGQAADGRVRKLVPANNGYELREADEGESVRDGDGVVAKVGAETLARRVVKAILEAASDDELEIEFPTSRAPDCHGAPTAPHTSELLKKRDAVHAQILELEGWLDNDLFPETARPDTETKIKELRKEAALANEMLQQTRTVEPHSDTTATPSEVRSLASLLAYTEATAGDTGPSAFRRIWHDLLVTAVVDGEVYDPWLTVSFRLRVRTASGDRLSKVIATTVPNEARGYRQVEDEGGHTRVKRDRAKRVFEPELFRRLCTEGYEVDDLARLTGVRPRTLTKNLRRLLVGTGGAYDTAVVRNGDAASAWLDAPAVLRSALYAIALERQLLPWVEREAALPASTASIPNELAGLTPAQTATYLHHLATAVFDNDEWKTPSYSTGGELDLRTGLAYVQSSTATTLSGYAEVFGWTHRRGIHARAAFARHSGWLVELGDGDGDDPAVAVRTCPHCGYAEGLHVVFGIDVPEGVICPACRRMPGTPDLYFPDVHFNLWEGPYGNTTRKNRDTANDIAGTRIGDAPAVSADWRRDASKRPGSLGGKEHS